MGLLAKRRGKNGSKGSGASWAGVRFDAGFWSRVGLSFLLGRTVLAGSLSPFAPAVFAGCRALGGAWSLVCGLAALAGSATAGRWDIIGYHALAMLQLAFLLRSPKTYLGSGLIDSALCGAVVAVSRAAATIVTGAPPSMYIYLSALLEGLCAVVVTLLLRAAFSDARDRRGEERKAEALLVIVLLSFGGLHGVSVHGIGPDTVAVMGSALVVAYAGGPGAGAVAGLAGGLVLSLAGGQDPVVFGLLGVSGLLAGVGGWLGRVESALGYLASGLLISLYAAPASTVTTHFVEQLLACAMLAFATPRALRKLAGAFPGLFPAMPLSAWGKQGAETPLEVSGSVANVGPPGETQRGEPLDRQGASRRLQRILRQERKESDSYRLRAAAVAHALSEISEMFEKSSDEDTVGTVTDDDAMVKQVAERVCRECESRGVCWEQRFGDTLDGFTDLMRKMTATGRLTSADGDSPLSDLCHRFGEVVAEINHWHEAGRLDRRVRALEDQTRECLAFQYKCLAQMLITAKDPDGRDGRARKPKIKIVWRGSTVAAEGASKSGDLWTQFDLGTGKSLLVLADGMGKGDAAAKQSRDTIDLMKSLLDCGLDYDSCVSFLNSSLYLAFRPESFIAIDCLLIDHGSERAYFHKFGAPPSFIRKKDGNVVVVRGSRPPAGAENVVACYSSSEPITVGDTIFLVSDGAFRTSPVPARAEHTLVSRIRRLKESNLDFSVKALTGQGRGGRRPPDDVTVVGVQVEAV